MKRGRPPRRIGKKALRDRAELVESAVLVDARSGGVCEARDWPHECEGRATQYHHVRLRSQGGDNSPENLLHLCTQAHMRIHAFPADAVAAGLLASRRAS